MAKKLITVPGTTLPLIKALVGFGKDIERKLARFPFEKNVFLMMRFRKENRVLSDFIMKSLSGAGLNGVRADQPEWNITNNVYNPIAVLYCCKYGIALFDKSEPNQAYNPNVIYELGIMHNLGRACLILRNDSLPAVPFDLIKDLYLPYKGKLAIQTNVQRWLQGVLPASAEPQIETKGTGRPKLVSAAVSAKKDNMNSVVASPNNIVATEFIWKILSRDKKDWKVSWAIKLMNKSPGIGSDTVNAKVQVLFLDKNGFALDDHIGNTVQALPPNKPRLYQATTTMSSDLAERIQHAMATVLTVK